MSESSHQARRALAEEIENAHSDLVRARDFNELKEIVRDLGVSQKELTEAQKRTNLSVKELTEAQKRTDLSVKELTEAQKRTDIKMAEMIEEVKKLTQAQYRTEIVIQSMRQEAGEIANSVGYQLENEAYRHLPKFLADKHGIRVTSKVIRAQVGQEEINVLAEGKRGKTPVLIVGEAKSRLAAKDLTQLKKKIEEVEKHYLAAQEREIVPVMVVHFARDKELKRAEREGVIVAQSFEW